MVRRNWYYLILFISIFLFTLGFYRYFSEGIIISHFNHIIVKPTSNQKFETQVFITGEYKTKGAEFVVGKPITICMMLRFNKENYEQFSSFIRNLAQKDKPLGFMTIKNSEEVEMSKKDICENFTNVSFDDCFVNPGFLNVTEYNYEEYTIKLKGDIVLTREGKISISDISPLNIFFIGQGGEDAEIIYIAPHYVQQQIETNKLIELLTFITVGIGFLPLFVSFHLTRNSGIVKSVSNELTKEK